MMPKIRCGVVLLALAAGGMLASSGVLAFGADFEPKRPPEPVGVVTSLRTTLQRTWDAQEKTPLGLDDVIESFVVEDEDVPSALARLSNEHNVLCGIAVVPYPPQYLQPNGAPLFRPLRASLSRATVRQILDTLVALDPCFEWREDRGVINLALRGTFGQEQHPLHTVIPEWTADGVPYVIALYGDPSWSGTPLFRSGRLPDDFPVGIGYSGPAWDEWPLVTVYAENETLLQILNDIAGQLHLSWWMFDLRLIGRDYVACVLGIDIPPTPYLPPLITDEVASASVGQSATSAYPCPCSSSQQAIHQPPARTATATASAAPSSAVLPLRASLAPHGFAFAWDAHTRTASAMKGRTHIAVVEGARVAALNGVPVKLPEAVTLRDGRMFVPQALLRLVTEAAAGTA